jgi:hypothetical protein
MLDVKNPNIVKNRYNSINLCFMAFILALFQRLHKCQIPIQNLKQKIQVAKLDFMGSFFPRKEFQSIMT